MAQIFERIRGGAAGVYRIVRSYPSTVVWPILLLGLVLGLGIWGVEHVTRVEELSNKDVARSLAISASVLVSRQLYALTSLVQRLADMVQYNPQYDAVQDLFKVQAPTLHSQSLPDIIQALEYLPHGVVRNVYPLSGNEAAIGFDVFNSSAQKGQFINMINRNATTMSGPYNFVQGGSGFLFWEPIFVSGVSAQENFGIPGLINPECGSPCAYNASSQSQFWGVAAALVSSSSLEDFCISQLKALDNLGFHYEIRVLVYEPEVTIVSSPRRPSADAVQETFEVADKTLAVIISPSEGWKSAYRSLLVGVTVLAVALALLMFATLVSRKRHQMLLEALLPKEVIRDLHDTDTSMLDSRILQAETTADLMLSLLNRLVEGLMPDLRDVVFIRQAIMRGADLYQPLDLKRHIRNANLDKDVARALMQQLGQETSRSSPITHSYDRIICDTEQLPQPGLSTLHPSNSFSTCVNRQVIEQYPQTQQLTSGYVTLSDALAVILGPQLNSPRNSHDLHSSEAVMDASTMSVQGKDDIITNDTNKGGGGGGMAICNASPRPSGLNFVSRALNFMREGGVGGGGGGGGGASAETIAVTTSSIQRVSMDLAVAATGRSIGGGGFSTAAAHSADVPALPLPRPRPVASMIDLHSSRLAVGDEDGAEPPMAVLGGCSRIRDDSAVAGSAPRVRRPPRKVASALVPSAFGVLGGNSLRRRSLLLNFANGMVGTGYSSGSGMVPPLLAVSGKCRSVTLALDERGMSGGVSGIVPQVLSEGTGNGDAVLGRERSSLALGVSRMNLAAGMNRGGKPPQSLSAPVPPPPPMPVIEEVERLLAQADSWQFDTWRLRDATNGHPLSALGFYLIHRAGLIDRLKLQPLALARLLRHIEAGYNDNPYHNATHAADVLQTLHVILHGGQLHAYYVDHLGLLAAYFAAIVHDYGHPGLTNDFLIATSNPLAVRYNDRSPLENHHAAAAFLLMQKPGCDLLAACSKSDKAAFRKQVIEMVLATDVKQHFVLLSQFNTAHRLASFTHAPNTAAKGNHALQNSGNAHAELREVVVNISRSSKQLSAPKPLDDMERLLTLQLAIKAADLGHLGEDLELHKRWLSSLEEEFFSQGDRERQLSLPISPLFDRAKQGVSKSQVGFYDIVALPLVHALASVFPGMQPLMISFMDNYHYWKTVEGSATNVPRKVSKHASSASVRPEPSNSQLPNVE